MNNNTDHVKYEHARDVHKGTILNTFIDSHTHSSTTSRKIK